MIERFSSRRAPLQDFLADRLLGARGYDRIAGYFSSSVLDVAGEAIDAMAEGAVVRVICNSQLEPLDVTTARSAQQAMKVEWTKSLPEDISPTLQGRLERLHHLLTTGRLQVRVLPDAAFGLVHGKAGVITGADGQSVAFLGSANETRSGWAHNYELVWTDSSPEGVTWVQEEFEALWRAPQAVPLADAVIEDIGRLSRRTEIRQVAEWKTTFDANPAAPVIELPVYRRESGLWAHQKAFVKRAFDAHRAAGARFVLADQVGLGKTVQLALAAKLMMLWGGGRVLALVPRPLLQQWQDELWNLLELPSAIWTGNRWVDEQGVQYPAGGNELLTRCPRRLAIVSTGLVVQSRETADILAAGPYECVILDEAHRARRRNLGGNRRDDRADPNNLLRFLNTASKNTRSLLLSTATPVQLDPIEAWDLLSALSQRDDSVLGSEFSNWRVPARVRDGLDLILGRVPTPRDPDVIWDWMRNPLPDADTEPNYGVIRRALGVASRQCWAPSDARDRLRGPDRARLDRLGRDYFPLHNPYIRHIVRRTREYLEETPDPATGEPFLKPVRVRLFGEGQTDALTLPTFLKDAYDEAEAFCELLGRRPNLNSGFLKTILLRRVGSTITAGLHTAAKMRGLELADTFEEDDEEVEEQPVRRGALYPLTSQEEAQLDSVIAKLRGREDDDPKANEVERILQQGVEGTGPWLKLGCIIFSQYYDSAFWLAERLSRRMPGETVAIYAGASRSGLLRKGAYTSLSRDTIKAGVQRGEIRLLVGTDAASEGLNLQRLGTLINLDLPWNPTRLEQRKGRIQRIGQVRDEVYIYNMRYRGSVEDRVHELLSDRLRAVRDLFGQVPDTLEDVWVSVALHQEEEALRKINQVPPAHPFALKYDRPTPVDWESCSTVLARDDQLELLRKGW